MLLYLCEHMDAEYDEVNDWAEEMERIWFVLDLRCGKFPASLALCKAFKGASMSVWREPLRRSAELLNQNGHAAIGATYFDRHQASTHYLKRTGRSIRTLQATFLVNTAEGAILDLHCRHEVVSGIQIDPKVALRNAGDLRSLAADKGYDSMNFRKPLERSESGRFIKHRIFAPYDHAHNARIDDERYHQRSMTENMNSFLKRSDGLMGERSFESRFAEEKYDLREPHTECTAI